MVTIAVVEDETTLRLDLVDYLSSCGHAAYGCEDGASFDAQRTRHPPDVVILDLNLPGEDGYSIATRLRREGAIGIIILSARTKSVDRVVGLEVGADVYLTKPVELRELEAQVRALARRLGRPVEDPPPAPPAPASSAWSFDPVAWTLTDPNGTVMKLTTNERVFFSCLVDRPAGEAVSRDAIMAALGKRRWDPGDRSIDALVHRLQTKAVAELGKRLPLTAVHGTGYAFNAALTSAGH